MPLNREAIGRVYTFEHSWSPSDAILYALAVGAGAEDPTTELAFTTEDSRDVGQLVLPTFAVVFQRTPALLLPENGEPPPAELTASFVQGDQSLTLHRPLQPAGRIKATMVIKEILDKGSGALIVSETELRDAATHDLLATLVNGTFARRQGGFGGERGTQTDWARPAGAPDGRRSFTTSRVQGLLYRRTGDFALIHSDPMTAAEAGFERPILHGLCTLSFAGRALLHGLCDGDPALFGSISCRFTKPVYPGEELDVSWWRVDGGAVFETRSGGDLVLERGTFEFAASSETER